jgi:hypothetical protein
MLLQLTATALALVLGAFLMVVIVHPGINFLRTLVGRDRCFGSDALDGCSTWGNGTLLCGALVFFMWHRMGFWSLALVPLVSLSACAIWTLYFWFKAARVRKREFEIDNGKLKNRKDDTILLPEYAIRTGYFDQTGVGSGYGVAIIQLGRGNTVLATNVYVDDILADGDMNRVLEITGPQGCRSLDLRFVKAIRPKEWQCVRFNAHWSPILCGSLEALSETDRNWWRQWCQPKFGPLGRQVVSSQVIAEHLERLLKAYPFINEPHKEDGPNHDEMPVLNLMFGTVRTRDNVRALRALLAKHSEIEVVTMTAHRESVRHAIGKQGYTQTRFEEDGIETEMVTTY